MSADPTWRGHSLEALRESEARVAEAYAETAMNQEMAKLLALKPARDHCGDDWRLDLEGLVMGRWECPGSPTKHCVYEDEEDVNPASGNRRPAHWYCSAGNKGGAAMGFDGLTGPPGAGRESERAVRQEERKRRKAMERAERERAEFRQQQDAGSDPQLALKHLDEVRVTAAAEDAHAREEAARISDQIRHMSNIESRFVRRRDHFLATGERNPSEGRQAAELAGTAERLRRGIEVLRMRLAPSEERATAQAQTTAANLARIDMARNRLLDAVRALELVKLEEASRERINALEQSSFDQLSRLGGVYGIVPAAEVTSPGTQVEVDYRVREVTRLAHEAEALVELQRERLS